MTEGDKAYVHGVECPAEARDAQELAVGAGEGEVFEALVESGCWLRSVAARRRWCWMSPLRRDRRRTRWWVASLVFRRNAGELFPLQCIKVFST